MNCTINVPSSLHCTLYFTVSEMDEVLFLAFFRKYLEVGSRIYELEMTC